MDAPDLRNLESRQDRDKREQEELLLLLLIALMQRSRNRADMALAVGADPYAAAADALVGNTALRLPPAWPRLARRLKAADVQGFKRTIRVIGDPADLADYTIGVEYDSVARQAVARLLRHVNGAISEAVRVSTMGGTGIRAALADAFVRAGLVVSGTNKAWLMETTAETLIGFAYNGGWFNGFSRPGVAEQLTGWRFSATLDSKTTRICRVRHGTKILAADAWRQWNTPPLHFNCRSVLLPIFKDFQPTPVPPTVPPPMQGFGQAPAIVVPVVRVAAV